MFLIPIKPMNQLISLLLSWQPDKLETKGCETIVWSDRSARQTLATEKKQEPLHVEICDRVMQLWLALLLMVPRWATGCHEMVSCLPVSFLVGCAFRLGCLVYSVKSSQTILKAFDTVASQHFQFAAHRVMQQCTYINLTHLPDRYRYWHITCSITALSFLSAVTLPPSSICTRVTVKRAVRLDPTWRAPSVIVGSLGGEMVLMLCRHPGQTGIHLQSSLSRHISWWIQRTWHTSVTASTFLFSIVLVFSQHRLI